MAHLLGGEVVPAQDDSAREYGKTLSPAAPHTQQRKFRSMSRPYSVWLTSGWNWTP